MTCQAEWEQRRDANLWAQAAARHGVTMQFETHEDMNESAPEQEDKAVEGTKMAKRAAKNNEEAQGNSVVRQLAQAADRRDVPKHHKNEMAKAYMDQADRNTGMVKWNTVKSILRLHYAQDGTDDRQNINGIVDARCVKGKDGANFEDMLDAYREYASTLAEQGRSPTLNLLR